MSKVEKNERLKKDPVIKELSRLASMRQFSKHQKLCDYVETIPDALLADRDIASALIEASGQFFSKLPEELRADREMILLALKKGASAKIIPNHFINDKEMALARVSANGWALEELSEDFKSDVDIVIAAGTQNPLSLEHTSPKLLTDKDKLLSLFATLPSILEHIPDRITSDKSFMLRAIKLDGYAYRFASDDLKADADVISAAIAADTTILSYAPEAIRDQKELVLSEVRKRASELQYASKRLRSDPDVIAAAQSSNPWDAARYALKLWSENLLYVAPEFLSATDEAEDRDSACKLFSSITEEVLSKIEKRTEFQVCRAWFVVSPTVMKLVDPKKWIFKDLDSDPEKRYLAIPLERECLELLTSIVIASGAYASEERCPALPFYIAIEIEESGDFLGKALKFCNSLCETNRGYSVRTFFYYHPDGFVEQIFDSKAKNSMAFKGLKLKLGKGYLKGLFSKSEKPETKYKVFRNLFDSRGCMLESYGLNIPELESREIRPTTSEWKSLSKSGFF